MRIIQGKVYRQPVSQTGLDVTMYSDSHDVLISIEVLASFEDIPVCNTSLFRRASSPRDDERPVAGIFTARGPRG